jgi:4a-hydroxytetrahydrobiopterin dehydratase
MPKQLTTSEVNVALNTLQGWSRQKNALVRTFAFKNYYESVAFVNATAWISHAANHHPDIELGYNRVVVRYSTHSAGGITTKDIECARKVSVL